MFGPVLRHRRAVGRSHRARLHLDEAARGGFGTEPRPLLAGAARRKGEPQRRSDALADRQRAVARQFAERTSTGAAGMGRRAVPCARNAAGQMGHRA